MLRVSSLGLRCCRHTLHAAPQLCRTLVAANGERKKNKMQTGVRMLVAEQKVLGQVDGSGRYRDYVHVSGGTPESLVEVGEAQEQKLKCGLTKSAHIHSLRAEWAMPTPSAHEELCNRKDTPEDQVDTPRDYSREKKRFADRNPHPPSNPPNVLNSTRQNSRRTSEESDAKNPKREYNEHLSVIKTTTDLEAAWSAYEVLLSAPPSTCNIPYAHLHRLSRLLLSQKLRNRALFVRLLSVLSMIHQKRGNVEVWQWNGLIDCAAKGWRRLRVEDYQIALGVFNDMVEGRPPGATFFRHEFSPWAGREPRRRDERAPPEPDIVTYTTLLDAALRTGDEAAIRQATELLERSGLKPNRITELTMLNHYSRRGRILAVRTIIAKMQSEGHDLGIDGWNACIYAFARNRRLDIADGIYRVLHNTVIPKRHTALGRLVKRTRLLEDEGIHVQRDIIPDLITYTTMIQAFAYYGHLKRSLEVFMHMVSALSTNPPEQGDGRKQLDYTLPAYRAIFLGFRRHGQIPANGPQANSTRARSYRPPFFLSDTFNDFDSGSDSMYHFDFDDGVDSSRQPWSLESLETIFNDFLRIPYSERPSERFVYWILRAFARTSRNDPEKLKEVFERMEERFGYWYTGRLVILRKRILGCGPPGDKGVD